jgi:hypothetical protein
MCCNTFSTTGNFYNLFNITQTVKKNEELRNFGVVN